MPEPRDPDPAGRPSPPEVLNIELEDLEDVCPAPTSGGDALPGVTEDQRRAAQATTTVPCLCVVTGAPFEVSFAEAQPGVFVAVSARATGGKAAGQGPGGMSQLNGSFETPPEFVCPCCGAPALALHEACQTVMCTGRPGKGQKATCPGCGALLGAVEGRATRVPGWLGGGKKGSGKR